MIETVLDEASRSDVKCFWQPQSLIKSGRMRWMAPCAAPVTLNEKLALALGIDSHAITKSKRRGWHMEMESHPSNCIFNDH